MKNEPRRKTLDANTERELEKRARQSASKSIPGEAPIKEHGQPAWREVRKD
jgi:hypothetical protein